MKLYHYVHCPFCVRVRMAAGYLSLKYESIVLPYHDEATPINLTGVKMLPIADIEESVLNESLDIIKKIDPNNKLQTDHVLNELYTELDQITDRLAKPIHNLAMPYWIWTPEFDKESREYFQRKKEKKRGPFKDLIPKQQELIRELELIITDLEKQLQPFYKSDRMTLADIILASHVWGGYIVPEFQFSPSFHQYLQSVAKECNFSYHEDFWR